MASSNNTRPVKQPSFSIWPCALLPAARWEHTAAELGSLHFQRILCSTAESGSKLIRVRLSPWKSSLIQKAGCSHANKCVTEQGATAKLWSAAQINIECNIKKNRSHQTQQLLNIRLDQTVLYNLCTAKKSSSKFTYKIYSLPPLNKPAHLPQNHKYLQQLKNQGLGVPFILEMGILQCPFFLECLGARGLPSPSSQLQSGETQPCLST